MLPDFAAEASSTLTSIIVLPDPKTVVTQAVTPLITEFFGKFVPVAGGITLVFYLVKRFGRA